MNPGEPQPKTGLNCRECGADNPPDARECWLCLRSDWRPGAAARSEPSTAPRVGGSRIAWLIVLIAMAALVGGIVAQTRGMDVVLWISQTRGVGLVLWISQTRGLGLVLWISLTLVLLITVITGYRRHRAGEPMSGIRKTLTILALICLGLILLGVAGLIALYIICTTAGIP